MLLPLGVLLACAVLGAVDDMLNLVGGTRMGLTARFKFAWLFLFAAVAAWVLYGPLGSAQYIRPVLSASTTSVLSTSRSHSSVSWASPTR